MTKKEISQAVGNNLHDPESTLMALVSAVEAVHSVRFLSDEQIRLISLIIDKFTETIVAYPPEDIKVFTRKATSIIADTHIKNATNKPEIQSLIKHYNGH